MLLKYFFLFTTIHYVHSGFTNVNWHHVWAVNRSDSSVKVKRSVQTESQETYNENCFRTEANLNKCIKDITNELLPAILKGIPQFNIPSLTPYNFGTIQQQLAPNLIFIYHGKALPSKDTKCYMANLDIKHKMFQAGLVFKSVLLYGNFTLKGTINNKPVLTTGCANFTYNYPKFEYTGIWNTDLMNVSGSATNYTHKIKRSNLTIVEYNSFSDILYHIKEANTGYDDSDSVSASNDLGLGDMEPPINSAITKIGNSVFTLISDIFCSLIPDQYLLN